MRVDILQCVKYGQNVLITGNDHTPNMVTNDIYQVKIKEKCNLIPFVMFLIEIIFVSLEWPHKTW